MDVAGPDDDLGFELRTWSDLDATVTYRPEEASPGRLSGAFPRRGSVAPAFVASPEDLVRSLTETGLMEPAEVREFLGRFPGGKAPQVAEHLARELVRERRLTGYQAGALLQGKARGLVIGNYLILDRLGGGGMGMVFKARHLRMRREVALKILPPSFTKSRAAVLRFQREAEAAAKVSHRNIVAALDADEYKGLYFLVMEYVEGSDLARLVRARGPLPVGLALDCLNQAAQGLRAAHDRGIYHRDIKPSNLILDPTGTVKVLDLGLARLEKATDLSEPDAPDADLTRDGAMLGTVDYMPPEQAYNSRSADHRSDIYSLGCTLYYLLTGTSPFGGETAMARLIAHREQPSPSLRAARADIPPALDAALARMLAKAPEDRYQSIDELIAGLEACRAGSVEDPPLGDPGLGVTLEPEEARPSPAPPAPGRPRRGLVLGLLGLVAVAALAAVAWRLGSRSRAGTGAGAGELVVEGEGRDVRVEVTRGKSVVVPATLARRFSLGAGEYEVALVGAPARLRLSSRRFRIEPGRGTAIRIERVPDLAAARPSSPTPAPSRPQVPRPQVGTGDEPAERARPPEPLGEVRRFPADERGRVEGVAVSSDGRHALTAGQDGTVRYWDLAEGREVRRFRHDGPAYSVAFSPDDRRALTAGGDKTVRIWDLEEGREAARLRGHDQAVFAVAFSPGGTRVVSGGGDRTVRLWDVAGAAEVRRFEHDGAVLALAFSPDGRRVLSAGDDRTVRAWDLEAGEETYRLSDEDAVWCLAPAPDGRRLLSGGSDGSLTLWDLDARSRVRRLEGPRDYVRCVAFLPDGRRALSGTQGGKLILWDVETGREVRHFEGPAGQLGVAPLPDGRHALSADVDGSLRLWNLSSDTELMAPEGKTARRGRRGHRS